jgi:hypothetical protein
VAVDDLGRIVQTGDYLTAENVMAGYNTGFDLTGTAFDRIDRINASALKRGVPVSNYNLRKIKALKDFAASSAKSRKDALQAEIERAQRIKDEAAREAATQAARVRSISEGYGGHDDSPGATGPTATGAGMGAGGGYQTDYGFIKDGGQLARYAGGAGFQGNPFETGGAFRGGLEGIKAGFTSPIGTETGLKLGQYKMFGGDGVQEVTGVNEEVIIPKKKPMVPGTGEGGIDLATGGADAVGILDSGTGVTADALPVKSSLTSKSVIKNDPSIFNLVKEGDYGKALVEGAKKFGKAVFTKDDGSLDKTALLAAASFGLTYLDALRIANEAGEELPREEYDEAAKAEFKEKYDGYLQNFFGGKADGGRIGFAGGTPISFSRQEKSYLFRRLGGTGGS